MGCGGDSGRDNDICDLGGVIVCALDGNIDDGVVVTG